MPARKSGHITLLDVARASSCSASTVSIVLSDAPLSKKVSPATRERVRAMAAQLGYHPDAHARSLRRRSSQTIGVLAFDLSDPYCIPIMRGIQAELQKVDYLPLFMDAQTQRSVFDRYLQMLLERRVEGVIVIASWVFEEMGLLADMRKNNVPVVIVGRDLSASGIPSVLVDNEAGGALAMRHLAALGHRRMAVILGPTEMFDSEPRWAGIQRAAREAGLKLNEALVFQLEGTGEPETGFEGGVALAERMLATRKPFTAVLAFDDLTALGVVRGLAAAGLRVPEDCSVLGFDDVLPARVATPAMTTVRQPLREMGQRAAERLLTLTKSPGAERGKALLMQAAPTLIVRMSTAKRTRPKPSG